MTKKSSKINFEFIKKSLPYVLSSVVILALVFFGSRDKNNSDVNLSLSTFATEEYRISTDQLSELYTVADLSDAVRFASADTAASNYIIVKALYQTGQTSTEKLEKPNIVYVSSRGVIAHTVAAGESMESIAARYGLSTDQIRWSNGLKTTAINVGDVLYLPSTPGIVYTVKSGDTIDSITAKYGSSASEIIALNDLELSGISEGMRIVVAGGSLPETERPEYVAPRRVYAYSYLGNTSEREGIQVIGYNYYGGGQCVGYALWYRNVSGRSPLGPIPTTWGNARTWASNAARDGYRVDRTPEVGAVFQTPSGYFGHVGVVTELNGDGSIVVEEANYNYVVGRITRSTIPASVIGNFYYIH